MIVGDELVDAVSEGVPFCERGYSRGRSLIGLVYSFNHESVCSTRVLYYDRRCRSFLANGQFKLSSLLSQDECLSLVTDRMPTFGALA